MAFFAVFLGQSNPQPAFASHFRGSLVTVEYHAPGGGHSGSEVHLTSTTLTRKGAADSLFGLTVYSETGGTRTALSCTGTGTPNSSTVDTSNPLFDIKTEVFTITGCFNSIGEYVFSAQSSARISGIVNTPNLGIQFQSKIVISDLNQDASAPIYNSGYMYNIAFSANLNYSTNLGGIGQGNTPVTYSLVTNTASALDGYGAERVPCSDLNTQTGAYRINSQFCQGSETITSAFGGGARYYALKVRATDALGQYSTRDVLLYFNTTSNQAPAFTQTPAPSAFTVAAPSSQVLTFCAQDPDVADTVNFTYSPTRSWITMGTVTTVSPATTPNTYCVDFTIAPPQGTAEAFNFEVSAYDNNNTFVQSASNLFSFQVGGVVIPGSQVGPVFSYSPASYSVATGSTLTVPAPTSTGSAVTTFTISPALPDGVTLDAATGAISGSAAAESNVVYTITGTDANNQTGTTTIELTFFVVVPTFPEITSITPRLIETGKEVTVTVNGKRLEGASGLVVRGISLKVQSNTATSFMFVMPAQAEIGDAEMSFQTDGGAVRHVNALRFFSPAQSPTKQIVEVTRVIPGFLPGSSAITNPIEVKLKALAKELVGAKSVSCVGFTQGPIKLASDKPLAAARAKAVCSYLKKIGTTQAGFSESSQTDSRFGSEIRRVEVTFTK